MHEPFRENKKNNNWSVTNYFTPIDLTDYDHDVDFDDANDLIMSRREVCNDKEEVPSSIFIETAKKKRKISSLKFNEAKIEDNSINVITPPYSKASSSTTLTSK